jgi:hypothetical protein
MLQEIAVREQIRSTKPHEAEMDFFVLVSCCFLDRSCQGRKQTHRQITLETNPGLKPESTS